MRKEEERKEKERKLGEVKRLEEEKRKLEEEKKKLEEEKKRREKEKMENVIKNMESIVEKKKKKHKEDEEFSADEIKHLIEQIVFETLDQSKKGSGEKNFNAVDALLEDILLEDNIDSSYRKLKEKEPAKFIEKERSEEKTTSEKSVKPAKTIIINEDLIDELVDELLPIVEVITTSDKSQPDNTIKSDQETKTKALKTSEAPKKKEEDFTAVQNALTVLIGENPSEDEKLPQEVFSAIIELDKFLIEQQKQREKKKTQVQSLLSSALDLVDTAVSRREQAEKRLLSIHQKDNRRDGGDLTKVLSNLERILLRASR